MNARSIQSIRRRGGGGVCHLGIKAISNKGYAKASSGPIFRRMCGMEEVGDEEAKELEEEGYESGGTEHEEGTGGQVFDVES